MKLLQDQNFINEKLKAKHNTTTVMTIKTQTDKMDRENDCDAKYTIWKLIKAITV